MSAKKHTKRKRSTKAQPIAPEKLTAFQELETELQIIRAERVQKIKEAQAGVDVIDYVINQVRCLPVHLWTDTVFKGVQLARYRIIARQNRPTA